jgi:hypothetical protein
LVGVPGIPAETFVPVFSLAEGDDVSDGEEVAERSDGLPDVVEPSGKGDRCVRVVIDVFRGTAHDEGVPTLTGPRSGDSDASQAPILATSLVGGRTSASASMVGSMKVRTSSALAIA